jgi:hypothetical protein
VLPVVVAVAVGAAAPVLPVAPVAPPVAPVAPVPPVLPAAGVALGMVGLEGDALTLPTGPTGIEATVLGPVAVVLVVGVEVSTDSASFPVSLDPQPASANSVATPAVTTEVEDHRKRRFERSSVVMAFTGGA